MQSLLTHSRLQQPAATMIPQELPPNFESGRTLDFMHDRTKETQCQTTAEDEVDAAIADVDFDANDYQVEFKTSMGTILVDLWSDVAPGHAKNVYGLAKIGFYDGIISHRIIDGFMVQIGCPLGTGTGGPGYTIDAEFSDRQHEAGVLSMARTADPNSAGSQFFLCLDRVPHFGQPVHGLRENCKPRKFGCCSCNGQSRNRSWRSST